MRCEGTTDPEVKRKTIGKLFIDVFEAEAKKVGGAEFLAQGTLYPDVIESVSFTGGPSVTIKSHHNVGGLPERMNMKLVEPLRELFKDEVRVLGRELGLPEAFVGRHPFPGPGLAIRCPGEITREKLDILRLADDVFIEEIRRAGLYDDIWQAFAVILPVKTVGVMGDGRTYDFVVGLRAVTSTDGMTADFYPFDMKFIGHVATRIINEVKGVNRVVYDVTSKPPGTIEWEIDPVARPCPRAAESRYKVSDAEIVHLDSLPCLRAAQPAQIHCAEGIRARGQTSAFHRRNAGAIRNGVMPRTTLPIAKTKTRS